MVNDTNLDLEERKIATIEEIEEAYKDMSKEETELEYKRLLDAIKEKENHLKRFQSLIKLSEMDEFNNVFEDGYFTEEKNRVTDLIVGTTNMAANVEYLKRENLQNLTDKLLSMRNLKIYFTTITFNGQSAEHELKELNRIKSVLDKKLKSFGAK